MKKIVVFALICIFVQTLSAGTVYIVNGGDETLSKYDTETGTVTSNILQLGLYANQIFIKDDIGYVVNSGDHNIQVIDLINETTLGTINCPIGSNPYWMTIFPDGGKGFVTGYLTNSVYVFNPETYEITDTIEVGDEPEGLCLDGNKLYVVNTKYLWTGPFENGTISIIDTEDDSVIDSVVVGINPQFCEVDAYGRLHVVCTGNYADIPGKVYIINTNDYSDYEILEIGGSPTKIGIHENGTVYLADGMGQGYMAYDSQTLNIIHPSNDLFASGGCFVRFDPNGNIYLGDALDWVNNGVVYIYSADESLLNTITVGVIPQDAGFYNFDVAVDDDFGEEDLFSLSNYPNPFSTSTTISFNLATSLRYATPRQAKSTENAQINIYNIKGQLVKQLKRQKGKGKNIIEWDGTDTKGDNVKSGIYLYQIEIDCKKSKMKKMVLIE